MKSLLRPRSLEIGFSQGARVNYRTAAVNPDGSVKWLRDWNHNLILDSGLNSVAARFWVENITYAAVGTGTNPVERDSGAITMTSTAGALVASANYFEAGDVGRLVRLDSGEQGYVTAYTDQQNVTWSGPDAAASQGTIYYVNRTSLQTEVKRTSTYRTSSGDNGSTWNAVNSEWTFQRTFLFSAEAAPITYREIGWSWGGSPTDLFGMDVFSGGDSLVAGQQYMIVVQLVLRLSPAAPVASPDVGTGGWNTAGNITLESVATGGVALIGIQSPSGVLDSSFGALEPCNVKDQTYRTQIKFATSNFTLGAGATNGPVTGVTGTGKDMTAVAYVSGNFYRLLQGAVGVSEANGTIYGLSVEGGFTLNRCLTLKFTTPQTKDNTHTATVRFRFTWNRRF